MVTVIDIVMRMDNEDEVQVGDNAYVIYDGTVKECKEYTNVHRLVVDKITPKNNKLIIRTLHQ